MAQRPLPVIMLSGINEEGMKETILALEWGLSISSESRPFQTPRISSLSESSSGSK